MAKKKFTPMTPRDFLEYMSANTKLNCEILAKCENPLIGWVHRNKMWALRNVALFPWAKDRPPW